MTVISNAKFRQIVIQGETITVQFEIVETSAKVALEFDMDQTDQDAVQTLLDRIEPRVAYMLSGNSWEPVETTGSFTPDK